MRPSTHRFFHQLARWTPAAFDPDGERMGLRVLSGRLPVRGMASMRVALAASDIDTDAGVAAVWLAKRSGWQSLAEYVCLYEHDDHCWQWVGGSRGGESREWLASPRPLSAVVREGGSAVRSYIDRLARPPADSTFADVGWAVCALYRVPANITHLDINGRQITVPAHGRALVAWKAAPSHSPPLHPHVVAMGHDGTRIAEFGPSDHFDSRTIIGLAEASSA